MMILDIIIPDSLAGLVSLLLSYGTNIRQDVTSQKMTVSVHVQAGPATQLRLLIN